MIFKNKTMETYSIGTEYPNKLETQEFIKNHFGVSDTPLILNIRELTKKDFEEFTRGCDV